MKNLVEINRTNNHDIFTFLLGARQVSHKSNFHHGDLRKICFFSSTGSWESSNDQSSSFHSSISWKTAVRKAIFLHNKHTIQKLRSHAKCVCTHASLLHFDYEMKNAKQSISVGKEAGI